MDATANDHVNPKIPSDGVADAINFYESLGFEAERLDEYESGQKPFFSIRLTAVLHLHFFRGSLRSPRKTWRKNHPATAGRPRKTCSRERAGGLRPPNGRTGNP